MQRVAALFWRELIEMGVFSLVVNILLLVMPLYLLQIYDRVIPSSSIDTLIFLSLMAGAALLLLAILEMVRGFYANRVAAKLDVAYGQDAILAAMDSPRSSLGDIQPMRDLSVVRKLLGSRTIFAFFDLPFAPLFIGLMWFIHPVLFALTAAGAVVLSGIAIANQRATLKAHRELAGYGANAMIMAQSFVRNSESLKAMGMVESAVGRWAMHHVPEMLAADRAGRINAIFVGISRFTRMGLQMAVLGVGAWFVLAGEMTAGMIFASSIISGRGLQPIDQVIGGWPQFVEARGAWVRLKSALNSRKKERDYTALPAPKGNLDIENLVYLAPNAGSGREPVLRRLNFSVPAGTVVVILGPSGAGKSTLARLIVGAIKPANGVIRIDGSDINNWDPGVLGKHIGYLSQDVELLPGTIAQNIARFSAEFDGAAVIEAAQRAHVHELVLSLPGGYDTVIGPQGLTLSGGQRQRIGLARALYGKPSVLVLDEPNANLDTDGETALGHTLDEAKAEGTTVLMITQRPMISGRVDFVMEIREGAISKFGPRDEVIASLEDGARDGTRFQEANDRADTAAMANAAKRAANVNMGNGENLGQNRADAPPPKSPLSFYGYGYGLRPVQGTDKGK